MRTSNFLKAIPGQLLIFPCLLVVLAVGNMASAALISVAAVPLISGGVGNRDGAEIPTVLPRLLAAWDVNDNDVGTPIVNGIPFGNTQPAFITIFGFPGIATDASATEAHYNPSMADIMGDLLGTGIGVGGDVVLSGLTIGQLYQVSFLHHQDIDSNPQRDMEVHFGTAITDPGTGAFAVGDNVGYLSTFTFTADAASQNFFFRPGGNDRAILNAVIVQTVPEPSSVLLLVLGGLGVVCVSRRCQRTSGSLSFGRKS